MYAEDLRRAIEDGEVDEARRLMAYVMPHLPQPKSDEAAAATLHHARTLIASMPFSKRAYSHAWLTERKLPSGLPDHLKPKAERMYPWVVDGVGIAVKTSPSRRELGKAIQKAMGDAVMHCYTDRQTEPAFVRARMAEARIKVLKGD